MKKVGDLESPGLVEQATLTGNNAPRPHSGPGPDSHWPIGLANSAVGGGGAGDRDGAASGWATGGDVARAPDSEGVPGELAAARRGIQSEQSRRANKQPLCADALCSHCRPPGSPTRPRRPPGWKGPPVSAGGDGVGRKQAPACALREAVAVGELRGEFPRCLAALRLPGRVDVGRGGAGAARHVQGREYQPEPSQHRRTQLE